MVKISGGRSGSVNRMKKEMERSSGDRTWIKNVKAGEDLTVRFLTEPEEWYSYREHYDPEVHFFPCIGKDNDCPGCRSDVEKIQRTSKRYLANVLDVEMGVVVPLKLAMDLAQRLVASYERYGNTITDRDYTLHRMGKGLETSYDRTPEAPAKMDLSRYQLLDLEKALIEQFEDAFDLGGERDDEGGERTAKASDVAVDTSSDVDDEVPSEPSASADEDDDGGYLTEEEARKMSKEELKELARQLNVEIDGRWSTDKMVDTIFSEAG